MERKIPPKKVPAPVVLVPEEQKITWKNTGGSFRMSSGRIIKPNQMFEAFDWEVPQAFRDSIIPADGRAVPTPAPIKAVTPDFIIEEGEEAETFVVKNRATGKIISNAPLSREDAEALAEAMNG